MTNISLSASLENAYTHICKSRLSFPPNSDIWHLRFHWSHIQPQLSSKVASGDYRLAPLTIVQKANDTRLALWSSENALIIQCLTEILKPQLPVHTKCEHVKGHGGGQRSIKNLHQCITKQGYRYVCRTDIKGYYANIDKTRLWQQCKEHINDAITLDLLHQFLHYSVEDGGLFHTPNKGIPRASALSPLLGAFHLHEIDAHFAKQSMLYYARYMDDFIILTNTRWHLRRAIKQLNAYLAAYGFETHPDKTFIGSIEKGFDWMGFWFTHLGCTQVAPRALNNHRQKRIRLYEQIRKLPAQEQAIRMRRYVTRWEQWRDNTLKTVTTSVKLL